MSFHPLASTSASTTRLSLQSLLLLGKVENLLGTFVLVVREELVLLLFLLQLSGGIDNFDDLQSVLELGEMLLRLRRLLDIRTRLPPPLSPSLES